MERLALDLILLVTFLGISALLAGAEAAYFSLTRLGSAHLEPEESPGHAESFVKVKETRGIVRGDAHLYRKLMKGTFANKDVLV